ncbi:MAG: CBS domain-containing protein [Betaproteobacteria bacterium]
MSFPQPPLDSIGELFHRVNRILPEDQEMATVSPDTLATDALNIMKKKGFSQIPVVQGKVVLGIFSYRSFSDRIRRMKSFNSSLGELPVEEFIEKPEFARGTSELNDILKWLERDGAVLVGDIDRLHGILTTVDILNYLYKLANPFVLIAEIELALRALITRAVSDDQLAAFAKKTLSGIYKEGSIPTQVNEMTFNDYVQIIGYGDTWDYFKPGFGGTSHTVRTKLEDIRNLRNDIFHFKKEIIWDDHERLVEHREWILQRVTKSDALLKGADL